MESTISVEEFEGQLIDLKPRFVQKPDRIAAIASVARAIDAPGQWTARTVVTPAGAPDAPVPGGASVA
ncbi:MAG TPA: hypothetical protein VF850_08325 [Gemmatimonadaceae bacterium]